MLQRYKKIAHLQVFYLLNVRLFYLDAIRGLFQCPLQPGTPFVFSLFQAVFSKLKQCTTNRKTESKLQSFIRLGRF